MLCQKINEVLVQANHVMDCQPWLIESRLDFLLFVLWVHHRVSPNLVNAAQPRFSIVPPKKE